MDKFIPDDEINESLIEFDIEESTVINLESLLAHNEYESIEIILTNDLTAEEIETISNVEVSGELAACQLDSIPTLKFCDEREIPQLTEDLIADTTKNKKDRPFVCQKCSKSYKGKKCYENHLLSCGKQAVPGNVKSSARSSKQSKTNKKYQIQISDEEFITQSHIFLQKAIKAAVENPIYNLTVPGQCTPGNKIRNIAEKVYYLLQSDKNLLSQICTDVVSELGEIVKEINFNILPSRVQMWHKVTMLINNDKWFTMWCKYFQGKIIFEREIFNPFFRYVVMQIIHLIIKLDNDESRATMDESNLNLEMTREEIQILHYVAGFIVFSLLKKYDKIKCQNRNDVGVNAAIQMLVSLKSDDKEIKAVTFEEYAKKWTEIQNRGGLVKVNDDMFLLIKRIERVVRNILNIDLIRSYKGEDLRDIIEIKLIDNSYVAKAWDAISRDLPNQKIKDLLKQQIITKWIDIRANAFVVTYVQIIKRKLNQTNRKGNDNTTSISLSSASEPSLRKTLQ